MERNQHNQKCVTLDSMNMCQYLPHYMSLCYLQCQVNEKAVHHAGLFSDILLDKTIYYQCIYQ